MTNRHFISTHPARNETTSEKSNIRPETNKMILRRYKLDKKIRTQHFETTMRSLVRSMPATKRLFSNFIHSNIVAIPSEVIGGTLARPNALMVGAVFAFIGTLGAYVLAKNFGYTLSGFETIGAFILGWIAGLVYDYLKLLVSGKP